MYEYSLTVSSKWMFPSPFDDDKPRDPEALGKKMHGILERAGCKQVRYHDLRHTFATLALEQGMDVKSLSAVLGHMSSDVTLKATTEDVAHLKEAVLLAKAASFGERNFQSRCAYDQLALATNMGIDKNHYSGTVLADAFDQEVDFTESCKISAYLYAMLFPYQAYDHTLKATTQSAVEDYDFLFPNYPVLKTLFNKASTVCDVSPEGFSESILDALSDQDKSQAHAEKLKKIAQPLLNEPRIKAHINGIPEFIGICFGKQSDLYLCMEIISTNNKAERDFVAAVFAEYCENGTDNKVISDFAIDSKIDLEWKVATRGKRTNGINLEYQARRQVFNEFVQRLELIKTWLEHAVS